MRASTVSILLLISMCACDKSDDTTTMDASAKDEIDANMEDAHTNADAMRSEFVLTDGEAGIGFDDLQFSTTLDRLLVPAGRAGYVGLVDPHTEKVTKLGDFSTTDSYSTGHDFGTTSAVEAEGLVYAIDRTAMELRQLDPDSGELISSVALGGTPDYVRFVKATRELWVTEPTSSRFEIFALGDEAQPSMTLSGEMMVSLGPESLVLSADGKVGYTNTFVGETIEIDTKNRSELNRWSNGCSLSLGIAYDEENKRVFVGCAEGTAVSSDATAGTIISSLSVSGGVDIIAYNSHLGHLYLNGSTMGVLTILDVDKDGNLSELATETTAPSTNSSCVASDPYDNIWVCDANAGQLIRIKDTY